MWREAGLPAAAIAGWADPALLAAVLAEHRAAVDLGVNGVPAVRRDGDDAFVLGAQPVEVYRRWVTKLLG